MRAVFAKEVKGYFNTLSAYMFAALMLLAGGAALAMTDTSSIGRTAPITDTLGYMLFITTPILTKRLGFGKSGIDRTLFSAPVSTASVIAGKYFAAVAVLAAGLMLSFVYPVLIAAWGDLSWSEAAAGYLGLLLLGAALASVGMFVSSFALSRGTAGILTLGLMLLILMFQSVIPGMPSVWLREYLTKASPSYHMGVFGSGLVSLSSFVYFITVILLFLLMAAGVIRHRRRE